MTRERLYLFDTTRGVDNHQANIYSSRCHGFHNPSVARLLV